MYNVAYVPENIKDRLRSKLSGYFRQGPVIHIQAVFFGFSNR